MLNPLILNICRLLQRKKTSIPTVGQWYTTPAGHVLRVGPVDRECQKVICEPLGRNYRVSMPLIAFRSGKKHEASRRCSMSMELMVKAMKIRVGNPLRKLVLIKLADNASDRGECWPSYQHIADQCEISKRSVMNHIAALCESGLVKKSPGKVKKVTQVISISFIWMVQEIH